MSTQKDRQVRREFGSVEESEALSIDEDRAEQLVDALNTDIANAYVLYHQLKKHHWYVEGAEFLEIHRFLEDCYVNLEQGADLLGERAQAIGGTPVTGMESLLEHATIEAEDDDIYDIRTSLENDLELYSEAIPGLREHVKLANNLGDFTTEEILRDVLETVEEDAHHVEHYLEDDTLVED
ncbi:DNA starvation/stationary phase protection protein DpsA [Halolamina sp.]|uniref:DNA starvation/stationary phase protection protein DpsA n=1 Tax=Halolamina sp. TaxID=1940283 RepID=UPI003566D417